MNPSRSPRARPRLSLLLALLATSSACATPADPFGFRSGTRLKAKYVEGGGTRVFEVFHDTVRDEDCAFGTAGQRLQVGPGGVTYCLPVARVAFVGYADSNCTEPLYEVPPDTREPVLVDPAERNCEELPTVHALGNPYQGQTYFRDLDGLCFANLVVDSALRVSDPVPIDRFVRATKVVEAAGDRLSRIVLVADDGARLLAGAFDVQRNEAVEPGFDGEDRWVPSGIAYNYGAGTLGTPGATYADASCTRPTAVKDAYDAVCPITAAYEFVENACGQLGYGGRWHEVGPVLDPTHAFTLAEDGSCIPGDAAPPWATYLVEMGEEIPLSAFTPLVAENVGDGALSQTFYAEPDEAPLLPTGLLMDRAAGDACVFRPAEDGSLRCMPTASPPDVAFADPNCTTPIAAATTTTDCLGAETQHPLAPRVTRLDDSGKKGTVFAVGASVHLGTVYRGTPASCTSEPGNLNDWRALDPIAPSALPLGEEKTDP